MFFLHFALFANRTPMNQPHFTAGFRNVLRKSGRAKLRPCTRSLASSTFLPLFFSLSVSPFSIVSLFVFPVVFSNGIKIFLCLCLHFFTFFFRSLLSLSFLRSLICLFSSVTLLSTCVKVHSPLIFRTDPQFFSSQAKPVLFLFSFAIHRTEKRKVERRSGSGGALAAV